MSTSLPVAEPEILEESRVRAQRLWCTVVHDDPVNTMSYVTWVFHSYFGFSLPVAEARMMQVHTTGRAVVSQRAHGGRCHGDARIRPARHHRARG